MLWDVQKIQTREDHGQARLTFLPRTFAKTLVSYSSFFALREARLTVSV